MNDGKKIYKERIFRITKSIDSTTAVDSTYKYFWLFGSVASGITLAVAAFIMLSKVVKPEISAVFLQSLPIVVTTLSLVFIAAFLYPKATIAIDDKGVSVKKGFKRFDAAWSEVEGIHWIKDWSGGTWRPGPEGPLRDSYLFIKTKYRKSALIGVEYVFNESTGKQAGIELIEELKKRTGTQVVLSREYL